MSRSSMGNNNTSFFDLNIALTEDLDFSPTMELEIGTQLKQFCTDQNFVALNLAEHMIFYSKAKDRNLVFSPLSIHVALGFIAAGSTGRTQQEVLEYLKSKSSNDFDSLMSQAVAILFADGSSLGGPSLSCGNGVWVDQRFTLKERFKDIVEHVYRAVVDEVDFKNQAENERKKLNLWAEEKTNGLIKDILPPGSINDATMLVFGNAVYFKGEWVNKLTTEPWAKNFDFYLLDGTAVKTTFMTNNEDQYVSVFDGFKVLGLPYKRGEDERSFSMYIFLPDSKDGLHDLVNKVSSQSGFIENHLPRKRVEVFNFRIPKFKICFSFDASIVLKKLGLVLPFSGGLDDMVDEDVYVTSIMHKSFIDVNEEGTEAAAVTFGVMADTCACPSFREKIDFVADHPFLFVIREDRTGMLLFVGHVLNPLMK